MSNNDLSRAIDTSDEWIRSRTGIGARYLMRSGESLVDVAADASRIALERGGIKPGDLDAIVVGTVSSEYAFPSFACSLQAALGADTIPAFDVAAACSGFVYALSVADSSIRAGDYGRVLVVGTDALSTMVDWNDRRTCVLFGDGAGAAMLVAEPGQRGVLGSLLRSSGKHWDLLSVRATGTRASLDSEIHRNPDDAIQMKGPELFKIAVKSMEEVSRDVAERAGVRLQDINLIVPHQANLRLIRAMQERLGVDDSKVLVNIDRYGNTTAATIPLGLMDAVEQKRLRKGDLVLTIAVGAGYTSGAVLMRWAY